MRKPTRLTSPLDGDLLTALPLVSRDAPELAGMSRNQPRWDGCSHNVLTRRYPVEVASLRRTTSSPWRVPCWQSWSAGHPAFRASACRWSLTVPPPLGPDPGARTCHPSRAV